MSVLALNFEDKTELYILVDRFAGPAPSLSQSEDGSIGSVRKES